MRNFRALRRSNEHYLIFFLRFAQQANELILIVPGKFLFLIITLLMVSIIPGRAEQKGYILQGNLQFWVPHTNVFNFGPTNENQFYSTNENYFFTVHVQDTNWTISITSPKLARLISEWQYTCVDDRIYCLTKFNTNAIHPQLVVSTNHLPLYATATVDRGSQLSGDRENSRAAFIWLALASGATILNGKQELQPVWRIPINEGGFDDAKNQKMMAFIEKQQAFPGLPINVAFLKNMQYVKKSDANYANTTNFVYHVTSWTNISGLSFPSEFSGVKYQKNPTMNIEYHGQITSGIVESGERITEPQIQGNIMITDYSESTNRNQFIQYRASSGGFSWFTNKDDARYLQSKIAPDLLGQETIKSEEYRNSVRGILIFMMIFPPLMMWKLKNKTKKQNKKRKE